MHNKCMGLCGNFSILFTKIFICPWTLSVSRSSQFSVLELRSRKSVRFSEQIMSADKYPCIFSRQMEAIVYEKLLIIIKNNKKIFI